MGNPNFTFNDINNLANKLLHKLYEATEGDEWESREIEDIYSQIVDGSYDQKNIALRNNVIQLLLSQEFIAISPDKTAISITSTGKFRIYNTR